MDTNHRPTITATAHGDGPSPDTVALTIDGVTTIVDVGCDRDDWKLPDVDSAIAHRALWAIDEAVDEYVAGFDEPASRLERVWARSVA